MKTDEYDRISIHIFDRYYEKILSNPLLNHIPKEVLYQWLYPFNDDFNSLKCYAWIDYYQARFMLTELDISLLINQVNVNNNGKDTVKIRGELTSFSQFCCGDDDVAHWQEFGTWTLPPVILDVNSFGNTIPVWADISAPYQLVEGHNRLGYLNAVYSMSQQGKCKMRETHKAYILKK